MLFQSTTTATAERRQRAAGHHYVFDYDGFTRRSRRVRERNPVRSETTCGRAQGREAIATTSRRPSRSSAAQGESDGRSPSLSHRFSQTEQAATVQNGLRKIASSPSSPANCGPTWSSA